MPEFIRVGAKRATLSLLPINPDWWRRLAPDELGTSDTPLSEIRNLQRDAVANRVVEIQDGGAASDKKAELRKLVADPQSWALASFDAAT
eukprot:5719687-Alexandrium_andersonii.AAC.1